MSCAGGPDLIQDGLVLHLDAADRKSYPGSGTIWTDRSGLGNNGTLTNGPTFSTANGGSIVFDGTNDYVNCGNGNLINLNGNFSISAWVYLKSSPDGTNPQVIIEKGVYGNSDEYGLVLSGGPSNGMSFQSNNTYFYSNKIFPISVWTYVVGTLSGTNAVYYENGIIIKTGSLTAPTTGNGVLNLSYRTGVGYYFNGNISNVQIYNRALSAAEIKQNYNAQKSKFNLR